MPEPFVADPDFTLYVGDVREVLGELPDESVDCVVTSPPYWGLRDYGVDGQIGLERSPDCLGWATGEECGECFVCSLVGVFRNVRRVLAGHGTVWLNLGDSYASKAPGTFSASGLRGGRVYEADAARQDRTAGLPDRLNVPGIKPKDLAGIPWRVALALQADGWWLRSDVVWSKPNVMPESTTDRPTKAHEYVFLLAKSARYFYDQDAIAEPVAGSSVERAYLGKRPISARHREMQASGIHQASDSLRVYDRPFRNARTVWEIATQPYKGAHFAVMAETLVERCVLAGSPFEVCTVCGKPRVRIVEKGEPVLQADTWSANGAARYDDEQGDYVAAGAHSTLKHVVPRATVGWSDCGHGAFRRGVVLDPFMGAGTTALAAVRHGRCAVGVELNPEYAQLAADRLRDVQMEIAA